MSQVLPAIVVIGEGWAALGSVGFLAQAGRSVTWISGSSAHVLSPLPFGEPGLGMDTWMELARRLGIETGELKRGSFLREFRNKAFREPVWTKAPTPETRAEVRDDELWGPETRFASTFEARADLSLGEIEEEIRKRVLALENVKRIEDRPVTGFKFSDESRSKVTGVILGSGEVLACDQVIYADRWTLLGGMEGLPKPLAFVRGRNPCGVLQAVFTHETPIGNGLQEGFFSVSHKESGEEFQRAVWGYFLDGGLRSVWTLFLAADEVEDNHQIAKKLRRLKQTLERTFVGPEWLPEGKADFQATVVSEQVRFEESFVFTGGHAPTEELTTAKARGIAFLSDGYGPTAALTQVASLLDIRPAPSADETPTQILEVR